MSPILYDASFFKKEYSICGFDGLKSMCNDDNRSIFEEIIQCNIDLFFIEAIESRGWLIKKNNIWIFEHDFCNRESLALTSG